MYRGFNYFALLLAVTCFLTQIAEADLEDGLVLYLPFDEGEGDTVQDLSPNGFVGTLEGDAGGVEWGEGKFGSALVFDGSGAFVEVPFDEAFDIKEGITMAAWVTANVPFNPEWRIIINAKKSAQGPWGLQSRAGATLETFYDVAGVRVWTSSTSAMEPDVFHHVAGTYNVDDGFKVYFDGVLEGGANSNINSRGELDSPPDEGIVIGHNYGDANRWWDGTIDEVMVYNRALSEDEMAELAGGALVGKAVEPTGKLASLWGKVKE